MFEDAYVCALASFVFTFCLENQGGAAGFALVTYHSLMSEYCACIRYIYNLRCASVCLCHQTACA